jgi:hypothetical protein
MRRTKVWFATIALSVAMVSCKNPIDAGIEVALDAAFSGYFETGDGTQIELIGSDGWIRRVGSYIFPSGVTMTVGNKYMIGMAPTGNPGEYRGYVVGKTGLLDWGTLTISGNQMTITRASADAFSGHTTWNKINAPSGGTGGSGNSGSGSTGNIVLLNEPSLSGARSSTKYWTITVPSGTKQLVVETGEVDIYSGNLGDLFVSRGVQPTVNSREPYNWTAQCASVRPNRERENCTFSNPTPGTYHILLYGYHEYYGTTLKATITK